MAEHDDKKPILVPVDFSAHSQAALLKACELADCTRQPIIILHVVHDPAEMPGYYSLVTKKKKIAHIEDLAQEAFDTFVQDVIEQNPDIKLLQEAQTMLVVGLPVNRILEMIEATNASMVVMGSHGRTGMKHIMLGSKAEQVIRLCPVPIMIVKEPVKHPV
jgi:nucleotide-binding universal stress UspA family protein